MTDKFVSFVVSLSLDEPYFRSPADIVFARMALPAWTPVYQSKIGGIDERSGLTVWHTEKIPGAIFELCRGPTGKQDISSVGHRAPQKRPAPWVAIRGRPVGISTDSVQP